MGSKLLGAMTGVALLASVGVASAGQRVTLTDAQLDRVVAGIAGVSASVEAASTVVGVASLSDNPAGAGHTASASILAVFQPEGGNVTHMATTSAFAF
jgi:succinate dehydrogenase/fumarate reductase flavoprotein subunit